MKVSHYTSRRYAFLTTAVIIFLFTLQLQIQPAYAATFEVDSILDTNLSACTAAANDCTLRGAITAANGNGVADTITFDATVFGAPTTINLGSALPTITQSLTIDGPNARATVNAGKVNGRRVFTVNASGETINFADLTITGGLCTAGCALSANAGGGIYVDAGTVDISNSTIIDNSAASGGGLRSSGTLMISNSTFDNNSATTGGGVNVNGTTTISNSTFTGNSSGGGGGGGLYVSGTTTISNTTISGNTSDFGGGLFYGGSGSMTTITHSTISGNTAGTGAGIYRGNGTAILRNTIVSPDTCSNTSGVLVTNANNILSTSINCSAGATDISTNTPMLATLGSYGGSTQTMPPLLGSRAIDAANNTNCTPATDQRGIARPVNGTCDIGAVESRGFTLAITGGNNQSTLVSTAFGTALAVSVTSAFSEPVNGGTVTFDAPDSGASLSVTTAQTVTISSGAASLSVTANGTAGAYNVPVTTSGAATGVSFSLTNTSYDLTVDRFDDDTSAAATACTTAANDCTLRGSITIAQSASFPGADTITFDATVFNIPRSIDIASNLPVITTSMTIDGPDSARVTINGGNVMGRRVFHVDASGQTVNFVDLTITGGNCINSCAGGANTGGGIFVMAGTTNITNSTLTSNFAGSAGGVFNNSGATMTISNTIISGNTALVGGASGGGVYNAGTLIMTNNTISGNDALLGGGLFNNGSGSLTVSSSLILDNAALDGDGVYSQNAGSVTNSCLVGNGDTAVSNASGTLTATGNWWGSSWGPNIPGATAGTGSTVSSGDSISGTGTASSTVNVGIALTPNNYGTYSTAPTGNWLTADPGTCGTCADPSGNGTPRVCMGPRP